MLTDVLLASIAPSRMASAMNSCRGMPSEHRMSVILPYEGSAMDKTTVEYLNMVMKVRLA